MTHDIRSPLTGQDKPVLPQSGNSHFRRLGEAEQNPAFTQTESQFV